MYPAYKAIYQLCALFLLLIALSIIAYYRDFKVKPSRSRKKKKMKSKLFNWFIRRWKQRKESIAKARQDWESGRSNDSL